MTTREVEQRTGRKVEAKMEVVLAGPVAFWRIGLNAWEERAWDDEAETGLD